MPDRFFSGLVKRARRIFFELREKPVVAVDDCVLEHILLYHGLIGSTPENQREFRDVRADILSAINNQGLTALSIALKLTPLWWEDRLTTIFSELSKDQCATAARLLTSHTSHADENQPLTHEDWRIRANAAIILAFLKVKSASPLLAKALHDTTDSGRMAFCHIAYALGKLKTEEARLALMEQTSNAEPWFRVDAVGALALFPLTEVGQELTRSLQLERDLKDYMAVAIAKNHPPSEFFATNDGQLTDGGCELIIGVVEAAEQTFASSNIVGETNTQVCLESLIDLADIAPTPLHVVAALKLIDYELSQPQAYSPKSVRFPSTAELQAAADQLTAAYLKTDLIEDLRRWLADSEKKENSTLRYALRLAGRLQLKEAEPLLLPLLKIDFPLLEEVIDALGMIAGESSLPPLLDLANQTVDVKARRERAKSKQPVFEDQLNQSRIYWRILKCLGNFHSADSAAFLYDATYDFAPDKRSQALSSLIEVMASGKDSSITIDIDSALEDGLSDPSPIVQLAALHGAAKLGRANLINQMTQLLDSHENTVSKQAFLTLSELSSKGHAKQIAELVSPKLKSEREEHKKRQIQALVAGNMQS